MNKIHSFRSSRKRPSWWPENESWPPRTLATRRHLLRRVGCFFVLFILFGLAMLTGIFILIARGFGWTNFPFGPGRPFVPSEVFVIPFAILFLVLGVLALRRLVVPLDDLLNAADKVGRGDYSVRVGEKGSREMRSLARAFNNMASRLTINDEQRRELLADVTHELRTPLTVVQGNLEGMLDGVYQPDERNLRSLLEETNILSRLVEDLRTLALAESGAIQLKKELVDLSMLIKDTLLAFKTQADTAGVLLTVKTTEDLPLFNIDPGRIRQVLSNLIANALRYTPSGGNINIGYWQSDGNACLDVQDTGPGIPPEELPHVFERFYKTADSGGMGLGLAIARHLVEAHSGSISAESQLGTGTTMHIVLPNME
jgi:two-component system, OmpR family, sensor histidine kinase BaeS